MTGTRDTQQDASIQAMLRDSGLEGATELRSSLEQLKALVPEQAPAPRADLAALLAAGTAGPARLAPVTTTALPMVASANDAARESLPAGVTSLAERRGRKRRLAIVGGAVVGAMTLGAGAVAASSEDFRHRVSQSVGDIFQTAGHRSPAPEHVQPSPSSVPALPAPAPAGTPGSAPSSAAPTGAAPDGVKDSAKQAGHTPATPPAVGRDGILPTPPHRPVTPGVPGLPSRGGERGLPSEPLPAPALPGGLPTVPGQP